MSEQQAADVPWPRVGPTGQPGGFSSKLPPTKGESRNDRGRGGDRDERANRLEPGEAEFQEEASRASSSSLVPSPINTLDRVTRGEKVKGWTEEEDRNGAGN